MSNGVPAKNGAEKGNRCRAEKMPRSTISFVDFPRFEHVSALRVPSTAILLPWAAVALMAVANAEAATRTLARIPDGNLSTPYRVERVAENLRVPWELAFLPGEKIIFTERPGRVRIIENGRLLDAPALEIEVALGNKMGMLGLVPDVEFEKNQFIYLAYDYSISPPAADDSPPFRLRVVRYRLEGNRLIEPKTLIEDIPAAPNHTGCRLVFGPADGKLYLTTGDADRPLNAQRLDRLNGKILRLNADGSIPEDNPFVSMPAVRKEIYSYGHRNPQGLAFAPDSQDLLDTEHGPNGGDEINWVQKGANYGWPLVDHARTGPEMVAPILDFTPSVAPGEAIFYRGAAFPELKGKLLVACLRGEGLLRIDRTGRKLGAVDFLFRSQFGRIRSVTESPEGFLYLSTSQFDPAEGQPRPTYDLIVRIVPAKIPLAAYPVVGSVAATSAPIPQTGVDALIEKNCAACHGTALKGGMASSLVQGEWKIATDDPSLKKIITEGLMEKGMPPNPQLRAEEIDALIAYLHRATSKK